MTDQERYEAAAHAMQSGVAMEISLALSEGKTHEYLNKDVRTGVNSAHVTNEGLATLLMEKGLFTREEYVKAMADAMEREAERHEDALTKKLGRPVKLA